jgi:hypothetical protein
MNETASGVESTPLVYARLLARLGLPGGVCFLSKLKFNEEASVPPPMENQRLKTNQKAGQEGYCGKEAVILFDDEETISRKTSVPQVTQRLRPNY